MRRANFLGDRQYLQSLLDHFAAQVPRFARQLLPGARYVACEKVDSSRTGYLWDPDSQRHLPFEIWQPGPGYASVFPSNATGVAFLRAELNAPGGSLAASPAPAAAAATTA